MSKEILGDSLAPKAKSSMVASAIPQNLVVKRRRREKNKACLALLTVGEELFQDFSSFFGKGDSSFYKLRGIRG